MKLDKEGLHICADNNGGCLSKFPHVVLYFNLDGHTINETGVQVMRRAYPETLYL